MSLSALSWPGTPLARQHDCTCPDQNLLASTTILSYGEPPSFEYDALCPVHGLEQLRKAHA